MMADADALAAAVRDLAAAVDELRAEADIRRLQARYFALCDTPCPEPDVGDDDDRVARLLELYTEDAVWEGVGGAYQDQFGRREGKDAIRAHFLAFWQQRPSPALVLNVHYPTAERIRVRDAEAEGEWVHCQPWIFADGRSVLRSSRVSNRFRRVGGEWRLARTRTENLFVAPLAPGWAERFAERSEVMRP